MSAMTHFAANEVTVDTSTGEAYISQRKAAELLGVANTSLQYYLENVLSRAGNYDTSQGLSSEIFALSVQYYALDARNTTTEAKALLKQIVSAGVKAYLYHEAGYVIEAKKPEPELSFFDSLAAGFARMAQVEREQVKQNNMLLELQERTDAVESRQSAILDQSSYFSVLAY